MTTELTFADYTARLREFISRSTGNGLTESSHAAQFNELALQLFRLQYEHNEPYRRVCELRAVSPQRISAWQQIPAVPTSAFKELELTSLDRAERTATFFSSGTTAQARSRHFHSTESLAVYEACLLPWFERHMLADLKDPVDEQMLGSLDKLPFLALTPPLAAAPNSSLAHMLETIRREFGSCDSLFVGKVDAAGGWSLDIDAGLFAIRKSICANRPLVLLGTAFNFVHLLDHFAANNMRYRLARGSRVMETGGYKGHSRAVPKAELHALITKHLGIDPQYIVTEYGMCELSSQAYDRAVSSSSARVFNFPPWVRAQIISPETACQASEGETGLIRIFDLANVRSVMAIQTEDLGIRRGDGFELVGRAVKSEPRGCSLMSVNVET